MFEVGVINYGVGNIVNVLKTLKFLEIETKQIFEPIELEKCKRLILPGVGAFDYGVKELQKRGFLEALKKKADDGLPILGICLGMQLMFEYSQESRNNSQGMGFFEGEIRRLQENNFNRIPRIGWFSTFNREEDARNLDLNTNSNYYYYAHSFYAKTEARNVLLWSRHNKEVIPVAVRRENIMGVQFHPEKSARVGLQYLNDFVAVRV